MASTIAISGASGLIGSALTEALRSRGDRVITLVRSGPTGPDARAWDPAREHIDTDAVADVDAVVNLSGAGIGDRRWNTARKRELLQSRVRATRTLVTAIQTSGRDIRLVNASAVGFYGDRGEEVLTEQSPAGLGFIAELVRAWEGATKPLASAGGSVACARSGLVLSPRGGLLGSILPLVRLGLAGPMGSGKQFWPIIALGDEVAALTFLIDHPELTGPVNLVGLDPVRQRDLIHVLGSALHRPAFVPAPKLALRVVVGGFAGEITASQRVLPERLVEAGFEHRYRTTEAAVASALPPAT